MRLTGRQRVFLSQFLDLYHETKEPLHYTAVAQRLGVSKITAYDMLRLLEGREVVQSEYVLRGKGRGAGRSSIVFRPTPKADALINELAGNVNGADEWELVRERILESLQSEKDYHLLLEDLLSRFPQQESPMLYAAELITALILSLQELRAGASTLGLADKMRSLGLPAEAGLSALAGLALGLSFVEGINRRLIGRLLSYVSRYQEIIASLSTENKERLVRFTGEVVRIVEG